MAAAPPDRFGKYHVLGKIAQGGMAEIYKVKTVGLAGFEKLQVFKKILPAHAQNPRFIRSFIDEARIAVSLNHRNIVQVFEFGRVAGELFLAMELIEGVNLRDVTTATGRRGYVGRPSIPLCCYVLAEVAAGLDYAHRRKDPGGRPLGIVHCDVSPQNVALSWEGYVKILDFGVARATFVAAEKGRLRGKPRYMSPEQTKGEIPTPATDVFALGVVAWELLTGQSLFDGPDVETILKAIQRTEVLDPKVIAPDIPAPLAQAVLRALSRDPAARGLAADLGAAFAQAHRELDPQLGSRQVARWLAELFAESPLNAAPVLPEPEAEPEADPVPIPIVVVEPMQAIEASDTGRVLLALTGSSSASASVSTSSQSSQSGSFGVTLPGLADMTVPAATPQPGDDRELETLDEKRRVVAVAVLLEGAPEPAARATRVLADLAYKQGAVVHGEGSLVVLFGLEVAGDDDVVNALRFSIDAEEAAREEGMVLRAGVRQAVVRRRGPDGYVVLGEGLEEAQLLARAAAPQRTRFGGVPGRLASAAYAFREGPPLRRRGRRVRVLDLLGPRPREPLVPPASFHGRVRELGGLRDSWRAAVESDAQLVCGLVGDAGIGKTRLCTELAAWVSAQGGDVLLLAGRPAGSLPPFSAVAELVQLELRLDDAGPSRRAAALGRARLAAKLGRVADHAGLAPAGRAELLGALAQAFDIAGGAPIPAGGLGHLAERVTAALSTFRALRTAAPPRLTIVEDWHARDDASLDVFAQLLAIPQRGAELVVVTARPSATGDAPAWPPTVSPVIRLGDLPRADVAALIRARAPEGATDLDVASIERRAGGNPLFAEELALALGELGPSEMPETARSVVAARVDRLPRGAKAALQVAAVIGPVFSGRLLEELLGASVQHGLVLLEQAGIVTRRRQGEGDFAFRHGLLQEVVYDALSGTARRDAHRRVGTLLSEQYEAGRTGGPESIARHLELGSDEARAAQFYLRAGRLALAAHDAAGAVRTFGRALELGLGAAEREREALAGREQALAALGDVAGQRRDVEALLALGAGEPRRNAETLVRAASLYLVTGELGAAVEAAAAAERAAPDDRTAARALAALSQAHERRGELEVAHTAALRAVEIAGRVADESVLAAALHAAGRVHTAAGRLGAAVESLGAASSRARAAGDPRRERAALVDLSAAERLGGDVGRAMAHAREAHTAAHRAGDRLYEADAAAAAGAVLVAVGQPEEAADWLAGARAQHEASAAALGRAADLHLVGRGFLIGGDAAASVSALDEALVLASDLGARGLAAAAGADLALALLRRRAPGDLARAERQAEAAAALAATARPSEEARARARLALALVEAGDARGALAPSTHALHLLERMAAGDGAEEIWYVHHLVLRELGDPQAGAALARAHASYSARLALIEEPVWRESFAALELHRRIVREFS